MNEPRRSAADEQPPGGRYQSYVIHNGCYAERCVYLGQSFPERRPLYGEYLLPADVALLDAVAHQDCRVVYSIVERDAACGGREYAHALIRVVP